MANTKGYHGSSTPCDIKDLWQTPPEVYAALSEEFNFVCDVAASDNNHMHENYLTIAYDSIKNGWSHLSPGHVYCNPPYSDITPWVMQSAIAAQLNVGTVMLVPADTSVGWFELARESTSEIRFIIGGRLSFINASTKKPVNGNNKGSMLLIWTPNHHEDIKTTYVRRDSLMGVLCPKPIITK